MEHPANIARRLQFTDIQHVIAFIRDAPPTKDSLIDIYYALVSYWYLHTNSTLPWSYSRTYLEASDPLVTLIGIGNAAAIESPNNEIQSAIFYIICDRFKQFIPGKLVWPVTNKQIVGNLIYENNIIRVAL